MHFEFLVEDQSGKVMLETLVPKLVGEADTFNIHFYKGIGRIPKNLNPKSDPWKRIFLDQLPRLLRGFGQSFAAYPQSYPAAVVVVCDLDDRDYNQFSHELDAILVSLLPSPKAIFCLAVEEGEAWFLGDLDAIKAAYPSAKKSVLASYVHDSICGTWEKLADAVYPGGAEALKSQGFQVVGQAKSQWAQKITPHMEVNRNCSPSFQRFRQAVAELAAEGS